MGVETWRGWGLEIYGYRFRGRVQGLGFKVNGLGPRGKASGLRVSGLRLPRDLYLGCVPNIWHLHLFVKDLG